jgi:hypothetical protein
MSEQPKPPAELEHSSEGRIRVRVPRTHRTRVAFEAVQRQLDSHAGVDRVTVNRHSGSILVEGEQSDAIHAALKEVFDIFEHSERPEEAAEKGVDLAVSLVRRFDSRLMEMTDNRVTLRWLVPATFITLGVRQMLAQGFALGTLPWYVLLYYGVDSFLKLYPEYGPARVPDLKVLAESE